MIWLVLALIGLVITNLAALAVISTRYRRPATRFVVKQAPDGRTSVVKATAPTSPTYNATLVDPHTGDKLRVRLSEVPVMD